MVGRGNGVAARLRKRDIAAKMLLIGTVVSFYTMGVLFYGEKQRDAAWHNHLDQENSHDDTPMPPPISEPEISSAASRGTPPSSVVSPSRPATETKRSAIKEGTRPRNARDAKYSRHSCVGGSSQPLSR